MSFTSLSQVSQDIIMVQFEFFGKILLMGLFIIAALSYISYHKKLKENKKDTPYLLVALVRTWLYALSYIVLAFVPLFIVFLYPQQGIDKILGYTFLFYRYAILIIGLVFFINILFYGPQVLAKVGGLNIGSKNSSRIMDSWLGKYKKLFRRG